MTRTFIALILVFPIQGLAAGDAPTGSVALEGLASFDSAGIAHEGPEQWRWLSVPGSRAVLNPSLITERSTPLCPALALHVGYYHGPRPRRMQGLAALRLLAGEATAPSDAAWRVNLEPGTGWASEGSDWSFHGVAHESMETGGVVTVLDGGDPWGWASYTVTPPADVRSGFLRVDVPWTDGAWALKIGHPSFDADRYVQHDTRETGVFRYDLSQVDGWRGLDTFDLKFFAVGQGAGARLARLDLELRAEDPAQGHASAVGSLYDPDLDLAGLDFCKYPIASMIVHGLRRKGLTEEAEGYMQAVVRDVIRAGRFSENYSFNPLRSWGVEDSIFGAAILIEFTLLQNGVRIDQGRPKPVLSRNSAGER